MKKIVLIPALIGVMGIGGMIAIAGEDLIGSADDSKRLTAEQIEKKALEEVNGKIAKLELETEGTKSFYEIEVITNGAEYDLKFDALSGELLKKVKDPLTDNQKTDNRDDTNLNVKDDKSDDDQVKQVIKTQQTATPQINEKQSTSTPVQKLIISNNNDDDDDDDYYKNDDRHDDDDYTDDHDDDDDSDD